MEWWHFLLLSFGFFIINILFKIKSFDLTIIEKLPTKINEIKNVGDNMIFVSDLVYKNKLCESIIYKKTKHNYKVGDSVIVGVSYKNGIPVAVIQDNLLIPKNKDNIYIAYFCQILSLSFLLIGFFLLII